MCTRTRYIRTTGTEYEISANNLEFVVNAISTFYTLQFRHGEIPLSSVVYVAYPMCICCLVGIYRVQTGCDDQKIFWSSCSNETHWIFVFVSPSPFTFYRKDNLTTSSRCGCAASVCHFYQSDKVSKWLSLWLTPGRIYVCHCMYLYLCVILNHVQIVNEHNEKIVFRPTNQFDNSPITTYNDSHNFHWTVFTDYLWYIWESQLVK